MIEGMAATWNPDQRTWNFTLWSSVATAVTVEVCDRRQPSEVVAEFALTVAGDMWTASVPASALHSADLYGYRVVGSYAPEQGLRCDSSKLVLDPQATMVWFPDGHDRELAKVRGAETRGKSPLGVLRAQALAPMPRGPRHADHDLVIYEMHVRGATMQAPHVPAELRGTFAGLQHHVQYIAALGVTAVELMPIHQVDPAEGNYWGYMSLAFEALNDRYVAGIDPEAEFTQMIQAFHDAGIEVLVDVVYNHTCEEDELGPTYNLRAIDNNAYYVVDPGGAYRNDAGCGNVVRAAHPAASKLILDSLRRYCDLGVDGFRFDLGSLLGRDIKGHVQRSSPLIDQITELAIERDVRLIAEPWDLAAYQVGDAFPGRSWGQWNGKFRDDTRSFLRGETGYASAIAERVAGSPDVFGHQSQRSINFVTAHDGFTLYDWVSYGHKHNLANGWSNNDGTDDNRSWNCGWEGDDIPTDWAGEVFRLREQQMRNALTVLMLSRGTPMMLAGDEFGQTQRGNNNSYNQDNPTSWLNWETASARPQLTDFVRELIRLRRRAGGNFQLFGVGAHPDLSSGSHSLAWCWGDIYVMVNAWWEPLDFEIQVDGEWRIALSSGEASHSDRTVSLGARVAVVLTR